MMGTPILPKKFKIGDIVKLKIGGPRLLVTAIDGELVTVKWFNVQNELQVHGFQVECCDLITYNNEGNDWTKQ